MQQSWWSEFRSIVWFCIYPSTFVQCGQTDSFKASKKITYMRQLFMKSFSVVCYEMHAFKWILIELNLLELPVTGKFTIKITDGVNLGFSFPVVSGKSELCFHAHKLSNSFTEKKIPELPFSHFCWNVCSLPSIDICYLLYYNNREFRCANVQVRGSWETLECSFAFISVIFIFFVWYLMTS